MLRNSQGIHAPLRLQMERTTAAKVSSAIVVIKVTSLLYLLHAAKLHGYTVVSRNVCKNAFQMILIYLGVVQSAFKKHMCFFSHSWLFFFLYFSEKCFCDFFGKMCFVLFSIC